jgi:hypothetical protein
MWSWWALWNEPRVFDFGRLVHFDWVWIAKENFD